MVIEQKVIELSSPQMRQGTGLGKKPIKVALVSCGLGFINRGVEVSTARWYKALQNNQALEVRLLAGGKYPQATEILNLPRDWLLKYIFAPITIFSKRRIWEFAYGVEQVSFAICLLPLLFKWRPDVIWTKEAPFAHLLLAFRDIFGLKYKIIFANGCGFKPQTYSGFDHIQHLHEHSYSEAIASGLSKDKMTVLPNCSPKPVSTKTRQQCREYFGYSENDWVITCIAAWNRYHKRIDYLIEEVAKIKDENVKLLLCGHPEPDAEYLKSLAKKLLPNRVQWHTLPAEQVVTALQAADVFVLPSLAELFGGVVIEAVMLGVPVITHHTAAGNQLADLQFKTYDLSQPDNLANCLISLRKNPSNQQDLNRLAQAVETSYSQENLSQQFVDMVVKLTSAERSQTPASQE